MTKFRVLKNRQLLYPDGTIRGERGYVIDDTLPGERDIAQAQADALQKCGRQEPVSPVDPARLVAAVEKQAKPKAAKKNASKKKAAKKKVEADGGDE